MRIGIDVDLTVADSGKAWFNWLRYMTGVDDAWIQNGEEIDYDLGEYFRPECDMLGIDPMDFWRSENLYDSRMRLVDGAKPVIDILHTLGHEIVFISALKGNHHKSKYNWLLDRFPYMAGFIGTREKNLVDVDVLIDDRNKFLNMMDESCLKIQFKTPYAQCCNANTDVLLDMDWYDILEYFEGEVC